MGKNGLRHNRLVGFTPDMSKYRTQEFWLQGVKIGRPLLPCHSLLFSFFSQIATLGMPNGLKFSIL